jgi:hypothetical protein
MTRKLKRSINKTKRGGGLSKQTKSSRNLPKKESIISEGPKPNVVMLKKRGSPHTELLNLKAFKNWGEYIPETHEEREKREKLEEQIAKREGSVYLKYLRGPQSMAERYLLRPANKSKANKSQKK